MIVASLRLIARIRQIKVIIMVITETEIGQTYECIAEHWNTKGRRSAQLKRVDEDDCEWRFTDGSELSYDWTVKHIVRKLTTLNATKPEGG